MEWIQLRSRIETVADLLFDKKAENILVLDATEQAMIADYFLIAEGTSERHVSALAKHVVEKMKGVGEIVVHQEGIGAGDWAVLDFGDIVVHIMLSEMRDRYELEKLWRNAKIFPWSPI